MTVAQKFSYTSKHEKYECEYFCSWVSPKLSRDHVAIFVHTT